MKEILIINGSGGVGKDTFVGCLSRFKKVYHTSIVNPVKELAKQAGWDGGKTERDRKFLSDLKVLIDTYNDNNYKSMEKVMQDFRSGIIDADILCIDMREKFQIEKAQKDFGAKTVLVKRDAVAHIVSNIADAGVFDLTYDYVVENNGTIEDLAVTAQRFLAKLEFPYDKVIYVSHPFQGKEENLREIESIVANLMGLHPNYLFLSPVHAFGYHYHSLDYNKGLKECLWLLARSTEMWVFGDSESSTGCKAEIEFCQAHNIPYSIFNTERSE